MVLLLYIITYHDNTTKSLSEVWCVLLYSTEYHSLAAVQPCVQLLLAAPPVVGCAAGGAACARAAAVPVVLCVALELPALPAWPAPRPAGGLRSAHGPDCEPDSAEHIPSKHILCDAVEKYNNKILLIIFTMKHN